MLRRLEYMVAVFALSSCWSPTPEPQAERPHPDYARAAVQDKAGWSPLHKAALVGDADRVATLVRDGADIRAGNPGSRWTPLHIAALYDKESILKYLVDVWRAKYDDEPDVDGLLFCAAQHGSHHAVRYLLEEGGNPNGRRSHDFEPQLYVAAVYGHQETLELLLAHGADLHATTGTSGRTALHGAAGQGLRGVQLLVDHGADVNARAADGYRPLHVAAEAGNAEVVSFLIERGADAVSKTDAERTAYDLAFRNGRVDVLRVLDATADH